ncbi:hypothetical protein EDC02_0126 [Micromonospora sp. Llam0]|nr:hypothetical protein EDC02_0126 [Micromonospora sp. Llam0]
MTELTSEPARTIADLLLRRYGLAPARLAQLPTPLSVRLS